MNRWFATRSRVLVLLAALYGCQDSTSSITAPAEPIVQGNRVQYPAGHPQLALLSTVSVTEATSRDGVLPARLVWNEDKTQRVQPAFSGRVQSVSVDVGSEVKAGAMLARIASPEFGAAQADANRAETDGRWTEQSLRRDAELYQAGVLARKDWERSQAEAQRARAEAQRASARVRLYGSDQAVNQQLLIRAAVSGRVVERHVYAAQEVRTDVPGAEDAPLFVITDPSELWVLIDASEADLPALKVGQSVPMEVPALPGQTFVATIRVIADALDPVTRTIKVRATVPNPQRLLKSQMLATVRLPRVYAHGVTVPASSVFLLGASHQVFVQEGPGVFASRTVTLLDEGAREVVVGSGLTPGENVVSANGLLLARVIGAAQTNTIQRVPAHKQATP